MNYPIFFFLSLLFSSCTIIGYTSGYKKLSAESKQKVHICETSIDSLKNDGCFYQVNVIQLQQYIEKHKKALVYEWTPYCKDKNCISPIEAEQICQKNNVAFCLIMTIYNEQYFHLIKGLHSPILTINTNDYKTDIQHKYVDHFFRDLTYTNYNERGYGRYYYFKDGRFIMASNVCDNSIFR